MTRTHVHVFDMALEESHHWLNSLQDKLTLQDEQEAYRTLRSVLHALRDQLGVDEIAQIATQMPMLIRGLFYEGWKPLEARKTRAVHTFTECVVSDHGLKPHRSARQMVAGVGELLREEMDPSVYDQALSCVPPPIRMLFGNRASVTTRSAGTRSRAPGRHKR